MMGATRMRARRSTTACACGLRPNLLLRVHSVGSRASLRRQNTAKVAQHAGPRDANGRWRPIVMPATLSRYVLLPLGLIAVFVAGVVAGTLWSATVLQPAAAADKPHPGMVPISLSTPVTEKMVY